MRDDAVTMACACCGADFEASGRRRYCSDACRQRAFRARQAVPPTTATAKITRSGRADAVYECPACERRYLGQQRCEDCDRFCRRLGAGGHCPDCDAVVAVRDLLGEEVTLVHAG